MAIRNIPRNNKTHTVGTPVTETKLEGHTAKQLAAMQLALLRLQAEQGVKHWKPYVVAQCYHTSSKETYTVGLPDGRFSFEIHKGSSSARAVTSGSYVYHVEELSPVQARYRFLRAVIGQLHEAGQVNPYQARDLFAKLDAAAGPLLLS